jgi:AcrR family transcriptional regulator
MTATVRRRDATRTREALVEAAVALFADRGFEGATTREIGERAGVDPALIARYFGSKAALYLEALRKEVGDEVPADLLTQGRMAELLSRLGRRGPGPAFRAVVARHEDPAVQEAARRALEDRLVAPLRTRLTADGADKPELRAELLVAAFSGVALARGAGTFPALAEAPLEDVVAVLTELFA